MYVPLSMEDSENSYMMNQTSWDAPESPTVQTPFHTSPMKSKYPSQRIDQTKVKTKMCRNYQLGIPCPFEDRCAFVHGPIVGAAASAPPPPPPTYTESFQNWNSESFNDSPISSPRLDSPPPPYAQKFRHDPYHPQGIVFEN